MGRTDGKEPKLKVKPLAGRGWRVLMCLHGGNPRWEAVSEACLCTRSLWPRPGRSKAAPCVETIGNRAPSWGHGSLETRRSFSRVLKYSVMKDLGTVHSQASSSRLNAPLYLVWRNKLMYLHIPNIAEQNHPGSIKLLRNIYTFWIRF